MTWFVFSLEAEYPGGLAAWKAFLLKNLDGSVPVKYKAPTGVYKVEVLFKVNSDGSVKDIKAITKHGYGMEEEAIRIIKKSGKWNPAIQYNEPVTAYRRQPITFSISSSW